MFILFLLRFAWFSCFLPFPIEKETEIEIKKDEYIDNFCKSYKGIGSEDWGYYYPVNEIPLSTRKEILNESSSELENKNDSTTINNYRKIFNDFVSISSKLIDGQLKNTLYKYSSNKQDVEYLYSHFIRRRNICGVLPFSNGYLWCEHMGKNYKPIIERLDLTNNNKLKTFCIIHNGISNIILTQRGYKYNGGFDHFIFTREKSTSNTATNSLGRLLEEYILDSMAQSGIFGNKKYVSNFTSDNTTKGEILGDLPKEEYEESLIARKEAIDEIKDKIFNNNLESFKKLSEYCVEDIFSNKDLKECKKIYGLNCLRKDNDKHDAKIEEENKKHEFEYGIEFYVLNRLSFVIYHDLMCYQLNNNDNNNNNNNRNGKNKMFFPLLVNFYKFFWNFCVYIHCYPRVHSFPESFYVKQYCELKTSIFKDNDILLKASLNRFNYFDEQSHVDGTLLHPATWDKVFYCKLLLKDGFNQNEYNRFQISRRETPRSMVGSHVLLEPLMDEYATESKEELDKKEEEAETEAYANDLSLSELRYNSYTNQLMSSIYLLSKIGISNINDYYEKLLNIKHELIPQEAKNNIDGDERKYEDCYVDCLYFKLKQINGLSCNINVDEKIKRDKHNGKYNGTMIMKYLVKCLMSLLELNMAISDDLFVLCGIYCHYCCLMNKVAKEKDVQMYKIGDEFFDIVTDLIIECLDGDDNHFKTRNYQWFKEYILHSNFWMVKYDEGYYFDYILFRVNALLKKQKKFIWDNIQNAQKGKKNAILFEQMCNFGVKNSPDATATTLATPALRQDKIDKGFVADANETDIIVMNSQMGDSHSSFNIEFENNTKIYLTKCLTFAHINNETFQSQMKEYFESNDKFGIKCQYAKAPVKTYDRCVVKSTTDYSKAQFPTSANILDFLRFSVSFNNINDLLDGLNKFVSDINNGVAPQCLLPNGILRIKNGFSSILNNWKSKLDAEYCDIKINLIYRNGNNSKQMIVEAQFLLKFLLKAKKMGHKYYGIVRQQEFVDGVINEVYNIDHNYKKFQSKVSAIIESGDTNNLTKHLFWRPNVILSQFECENGDGYIYPFIQKLGWKIDNQVLNHKIMLLFLNCLFHYSFILLGETKDKDNIFLKRYFCWFDSNHVITNGTSNLWGIYDTYYDKFGTVKTIIDLIFQQEYLSILTHFGTDIVCK